MLEKFKSKWEWMVSENMESFEGKEEFIVLSKEGKKEKRNRRKVYSKVMEENGDCRIIVNDISEENRLSPKNVRSFFVSGGMVFAESFSEQEKRELSDAMIPYFDREDARRNLFGKIREHIFYMAKETSLDPSESLKGDVLPVISDMLFREIVDEDAVKKDISAFCFLKEEYRKMPVLDVYKAITKKENISFIKVPMDNPSDSKKDLEWKAFSRIVLMLIALKKLNQSESSYLWFKNPLAGIAEIKKLKALDRDGFSGKVVLEIESCSGETIHVKAEKSFVIDILLYLFAKGENKKIHFSDFSKEDQSYLNERYGKMEDGETVFFASGIRSFTYITDNAKDSKIYKPYINAIAVN